MSSRSNEARLGLGAHASSVPGSRPEPGGVEQAPGERQHARRRARPGPAGAKASFKGTHHLGVGALGRLLFSLCLCALVVLAGSAQAQQPKAATHLQKVRTFHSAAEFSRLTQNKVKLHRTAYCRKCSGDVRATYDDLLIGSDSGVVLQMPRRKPLPYALISRVSGSRITVLAAKYRGEVWIGTRRGLYRFEEPRHNNRPPSIEYFAGKRWLPGDWVTAIGFEAEPSSAVWVETPQGFSRIEYKEMTLAGKARVFEERVRARHLRHGFTASSHLRVPGDLKSNQTVSSDNDGLWTAMYLVGECFRYKVTGEEAARDYARQAIQALMRLESITGLPGFPARSFIKLGVDEQPTDGEWHTTPDGEWRWKGDTSSDEIVGHYLAYAVYYDLVADEGEKRQIRAVVDRITSHILDHGYHLIDVDGQPTRWGWWAPEEIWADPDETGLRALHLLSHLRVAHHITGQAKYQTAYSDLVTKHRYAQLTRNQKINVPGHVNHSDDELAFLSYYPLLLYETDPQLKKVYVESLERSWQIERPERNPLWNFIYAVGTGSQEYDAAEALLTLQQIPMDLISWSVKNSHRLDVVLDPAADRFKRKQSLLVLPPDERPVMKWNGNPYAIDGGDGGRSEDDGAFFLLPYWMGRFYKLIHE